MCWWCEEASAAKAACCCCQSSLLLLLDAVVVAVADAADGAGWSAVHRGESKRHVANDRLHGYHVGGAVGDGQLTARDVAADDDGCAAAVLRAGCCCVRHVAGAQLHLRARGQVRFSEEDSCGVQLLQSEVQLLHANAIVREDAVRVPENDVHLGVRVRRRDGDRGRGRDRRGRWRRRGR